MLAKLRPRASPVLRLGIAYFPRGAFWFFFLESAGAFATGGGPKTVKFIVENKVSAESFRSIRK